MKTMLGRGLAALAEDEGENRFRQLALNLIVPFRKSVWLPGSWTVCLGPAQAGGGRGKEGEAVLPG